MRNVFRYIGLALALMAMPAGSAAAATTVGQVAPEADPTNCTPETALVTESVSDGNVFMVPLGGGVITSWQTKAGAGSANTTAKLKVFRSTADPDQWLVVGQSGFASITASSLNGPFPARVAVQAGDFVSILTGDNGGPCAAVTGDNDDASRVTQGQGDGANGTNTIFNPALSLQQRANVSANLEADGDKDAWGDETQDRCVGVPGPDEGCPDNDFTIGELKPTKKATVVVEVTVPGPGSVVVEDGRVKRKATKQHMADWIRRNSLQVAAGTIRVVLKPRGLGKRMLNTVGRLRLPVEFTFTPTGFTAKSERRTVGFKPRLPKKLKGHPRPVG